MAAIHDNLLYLYERSGLTRSELARQLKLGRSTVTRTLDGKIEKPSRDLLDAFVRFFGVGTSDLYMNSDLFVEKMKNRQSSIPLLSFRAVDMHRAKWDSFFKRIKGNYLIYYGRTDDGCTIVSWLEFLSLTERGIEIRMYNPFRQEGEITYYEYKGFAYPVNELVYIFAEQINGNDYEILFIVLMLGRTPPRWV